LEDLKRRDQIDSSRSIAPLKPAEDAFMIDSDNMNADEVYEYIVKLMKEKGYLKK